MQSARNGMQRWLLGAYAAKIYGYAEEPAQRAAQPLPGADRTRFLQQTVCAGGGVFAADAFGGTAICAAETEIRANCQRILSVGAK